MDRTFRGIDRTDSSPTRRDGRMRAHRRDRRLDRRWIVAAVTIGLTALSLTLAAPASAHGSHDGVHGGHHHSATASAHPQGGSATGSTPPSGSTQNAAVDPPASAPVAGAMPQVLPGHDKCKAAKGGALPGPPWCTDPSAGWEQSTLHRTDASFPTLPGAEAAAETGRAAASRGATIGHVSPPAL
jgi:hypothetical protein